MKVRLAQWYLENLGGSQDSKAGLRLLWLFLKETQITCPQHPNACSRTVDTAKSPDPQPQSTFSPTCPSINQFILHPLIYLPIFPFAHLLIHPPIHLLMHPTHLPINSSINSPIPKYTHPSSHPLIYHLFTHSSSHSHLHTWSRIHPLGHLPTHSAIFLSIPHHPVSSSSNFIDTRSYCGESDRK